MGLPLHTLRQFIGSHFLTLSSSTHDASRGDRTEARRRLLSLSAAVRAHTASAREVRVFGRHVGLLPTAPPSATVFRGGRPSGGMVDSADYCSAAVSPAAMGRLNEKAPQPALSSPLSPSRPLQRASTSGGGGGGRPLTASGSDGVRRPTGGGFGGRFRPESELRHSPNRKAVPRGISQQPQQLQQPKQRPWTASPMTSSRGPPSSQSALMTGPRDQGEMLISEMASELARDLDRLSAVPGMDTLLR